jgi:molecular chaperone DnaJ
MKRDLYEALEVPRTATEDELRKQYRKLARTYHPDFNPGDKSAEERFKEISVAYEILSDPKKRQAYDEFGEASLAQGFDPDRAREHARWQRAAAWSSAGPGGADVDIHDLFSNLFGRGGGRAGASRARQIRGADLESTVRLGLPEALRGTQIKLKITGRTSCPACQGSGQRNGERRPCPACHGTGQRIASGGPHPLRGRCPECGGSGRTSGPTCPKCGGLGVVEEPTTISVNVPAGVDDGSRVRVAGKGEPGIGGGPAGDLYLTVEVVPHPWLTREGDDLTMVLPVSVPEAVLGATVAVPLVDGEAHVKIPPGSQSGQKLRLKGKGAPRPKASGAGDLLLVLEVRLPDEGGEALQRAAESMKPLYVRDLRAGMKI